MHKAQLARLPAGDGRRADRRMVNLAASLREPGAELADAEVLNLSTDGFMAQSEMPLEMGFTVWLKLPGMEAQKSHVVWVEEGKAGFEFANPLHPGVLDQLSSHERSKVPRNHFGARHFGRS